jgi:CDP-diacylglycerol--serine O-phosphatidyltransferase
VSWAEALVTAIYLMLPVIFGGILHMVVVKAGWLSGLAQPIHLKSFGKNKTWRGMLVMPLATVLGVYVTRGLDGLGLFGSLARIPYPEGSAWTLGTLLGLGYALSELPNSFIKRRLGIQEGKLPARNRFWFGLVDQADCAIGCGLVFVLAMDVPLSVLAICVALGPAIHLVANVSLYAAGIRKQPF